MNGDCFIQGMAFDFAQSPAKERGTPKICGVSGYAQGMANAGLLLNEAGQLVLNMPGSADGYAWTWYPGFPPDAGNENAPWVGYNWASSANFPVYFPGKSGGRKWRFDLKAEFYRGATSTIGPFRILLRAHPLVIIPPPLGGYDLFGGTPKEYIYSDGYSSRIREGPPVPPLPGPSEIWSWEAPVPTAPALLTHRIEVAVPEYCNPIWKWRLELGGDAYAAAPGDRICLVSINITRIDDYWIPYFNLNTNVGKAPLAVTFYDITTLDGSIASRLWNFGDGTTSTVGPNVTKTYNTVGVFPVRLTVTDSTGQVRTSTTRYVTVNVSADFTWSRVTFGPNWIYTFQPVVGASATHHWDFGAHGTSTSVNPQVTVPVLSSGLNATHVATQNGTTDTVTKNVN